MTAPAPASEIEKAMNRLFLSSFKDERIRTDISTVLYALREARAEAEKIKQQAYDDGQTDAKSEAAADAIAFDKDLWAHITPWLRERGMTEGIDHPDGCLAEWITNDLTEYERVLKDEASSLRARVASLEEGIQRLADAADTVGVQFFDTDDMPEEVEAMQTATLAARALLSPGKDAHG